MNTAAVIQSLAERLAERARERVSPIQRQKVDGSIAALMETLEMKPTSRATARDQMIKSAEFIANTASLLASPRVAMSAGIRSRWEGRLRVAVRELESARAMWRFMP